MSDVDRLIREALEDQDRLMLKEAGDLGWFQLGLAQFRGRLGWVTWVIMVAQLAMFLAGIWCAVQFFAATDVLAALKYGMSGAVLILIASGLKFSLMPQMQADRVLREVKRLELLLLDQGNAK